MPLVARALAHATVLWAAFVALLAARAVPIAVKAPVVVVLGALLCRACIPGGVPNPAHAFPLPVALLPLASWLVLFALPRSLPPAWLPPVDIHTLPAIDTALVGQPANLYFDAYPSVARDILAWLLYGVWHYVSAAVCGIALAYWGWARRARAFLENDVELRLPATVQAPKPLFFVHHRRTRSWTARLQLVVRRARELECSLALLKCFLVVFGCSNLAGVMIQYLFPTAPPWFRVKYGPDYQPEDPRSVLGDPAGLARIDALFHTTFYQNMFEHSPLVFGAFPSLHAGFATAIAVFVMDQFPAWRIPVGRRRVLRIPTFTVMVPYVLGIWWATMYLTHHYLTDVMGGTLLVLLFYAPVRMRVRAIRHLYASQPPKAHRVPRPVLAHHSMSPDPPATVPLVVAATSRDVAIDVAMVPLTRSDSDNAPGETILPSLIAEPEEGTSLLQ